MIVLATTLAAMIALEWRLTIVAVLLLPLFIIPAKRVGRKLQAITRDAMELNAGMNTQMTERFNVAGAQLVKLFGGHGRETDEFADKAGQVRDIGIRSAMYSRFFLVDVGLVGAIGTAAVYCLGGLHGHRRQHHDRHPRGAGRLLVARIYEPLTGLTNARVDVMTRVRELRAGLRGARRAQPRGRPPRSRPSSPTPQGRIEFDHVTFPYPTAGEGTIASLEAGGAGAGAPRRPPGGAARHRPHRRAGPDRGPGRSVRCRQVDPRRPSSPGSTT